MNRELKFRAWDTRTKGKGKMVFMDPYGESFTGTDFIEEDGWKVMQFTGIRDKNGREIYEGDILRDDDGLAVCAWCNNMSGWGYCLIETDGSYNGAEGTMAEWATECEIIGNIYENPELLEPMRD